MRRRGGEEARRQGGGEARTQGGGEARRRGRQPSRRGDNVQAVCRQQENKTEEFTSLKNRAGNILLCLFFNAKTILRC